MKYLADILNALAGIIEKAGAGPLAFMALAAIIVAYLAARWFGKDHVSIRLIVFLVVLAALGTVPFIVQIVAGSEEPKPPPPIRPAEQPAPGKFIVFFDWDKVSITPESASVLNLVAKAYHSRKGYDLYLQGRGYHDELTPKIISGESRNKSVKAALVERGIPENRILTMEVGSDRPPVTTAVPEIIASPAARRVEIEFKPIE